MSKEVQWRTKKMPSGGTPIDFADRWGLEVHHSVTPKSRPLVEAVRGIYGTHTNPKREPSPMADIFYNALIHDSGDFVVGRPWDRCAHGTSAFTICFLGDFSKPATKLSKEAKATGLLLLHHLTADFGVAPNLRTHGERDATQCPGLDPQAWVDELRATNWHQGGAVDMKLNKPICTILPTGNGYLLVGQDGGLFAFGDAAELRLDQFSLPGQGVTLADDQLIVDAKLTPTRRGLYLAGADGGVFAFGDAAFHGSLAG